MRKFTTEEFIEKANQIHNNKYDYSKTNYIDSQTKVKIICPTHGEFEQLPNNHLNYKRGCRFCKTTKTTEQFIQEAKQVHGDKYDYTLVKYINNNTKVKIICPTHGEFEQLPKHHLSGVGCSKCAGVAKLTTEEFIKKANEVHNNKYDYSLIVYKGRNDKIKIVCKKHGVFSMLPGNHLNGQGCSKCSKYRNRYTTESYIEKANQIHNNKYDYSKLDFKNMKTKVEIICKEHGSFFQSPETHLKRGYGCPSCKTVSNGEKNIRKFLTNNNIPFEEQKTFDDLKDKQFLSYDFYIPEKNLLIEYNGIQHYKPREHFGGLKQLEIQKRHDKLKKDYADKNNINLLVIKYNENLDSILSETFKS